MHATSDPAQPRPTPRYFTRVLLMSGAGYWERGRLFYNGALLLLTFFLILIRWPDSRDFVFAPNFILLGVYVFLTNVFYSMAYLVEDVLQTPALRPCAPIVRWITLLFGIAIACLHACVALDFVLVS